MESIPAPSTPMPNIGDKPIEEMTDRELAEETLFWLRETGKAIAEIQKQGLGGIMKSIMGGRK